MTANAEHSIGHITDLMKFSEEEFHRFIPDLIAWWSISKIAQDAGAEITGMRWIDDRLYGRVDHIDVTIKETGKKETWSFE
jgi:hypothetical protein